MPTYQYRCTACGNDLEVVQRFTDDALTECPECNGQLRKVYNAVGVVFKGSGFYKTDSRSPSESGGSSASGDKSSADKPAEKPAAPDKAASSSPATTSSSSTSGSSTSSN